MNTMPSALTPMMEQFFSIKKEYPDFILFFRLGDFYEMFDKDAIIASKILGLTLTKRQQFDMCGIPHHSKDNYIYKLIEAQYKVAMCEQVEVVQNNKKMFDRKVVELITPGTFFSEQLQKNNTNSFLMALWHNKLYYFFTLTDINTGKIFSGKSNTFEDITTQIEKFNPTEIIFSQDQTTIFTSLSNYYHNSIDSTESVKNYDELIKKQFKVPSITSLNLDPGSAITIAMSLQYLKTSLFKNISHLNHLEFIQTDTMKINTITLKNLELVNPIYSENQNFTLFSFLNHTKTVMGARYLRHIILHPSTNKEKIDERLSYVSFFVNNSPSIIRNILAKIPDIERILGKIALKTINPKDIWALHNAIDELEKIYTELSNTSMKPIIPKEIGPLQQIKLKIQSTLIENPPNTFGDDSVILDSYSVELQELRTHALKSYQILAGIEKAEQESSGISKLRIKYNKILGYHIEIPKAAAERAPSYYIRKQTLSNLERFTIEKLISFEQEILTAKDSLLKMELSIFQELCLSILESSSVFQEHIQFIKDIDIFTTFAIIALENNYIQPIINVDFNLKIRDGRHPIVEKYTEIFTPNSVELNNTDSQLWLISGPNMAGKSTFLRQIAIITLMAHIGCFVPAAEALIPLTDQIFTRIGASDNLAKGESTFLVEMAETASILNFITPRTLIIMDEVGRGTSTTDGLSIAQAMVEYLAKKHYGKTLFATHYHELSVLESRYTNIQNYRMAVKESNDNIVFLHKIEKGSTNNSYGIHVAELAGVPQEIILRAKEILEELQITEIRNTQKPPTSKLKPEKKEIITNSPVIDKIIKLDINKISGIDALNLINTWKKELDTTKKNSEDIDSILF